MLSQHNTKSLTGIRGIAILLVMLCHASTEGLSFHKLLAFSGAGRYGVFLFFVLSSFLLTRQFLLSTTLTPKSLLYYFIKRFLRIYPLFLVTALICCLFGLYSRTFYHFAEPSTIMKMLLLIDCPGAFWTIPVEMQYYVFIPIISFILIKSEKNIIRNLILLTLFIIIWQSIFHPAYTKNVYRYLSIFLIGSFTAYVEVYLTKTKVIQKKWFTYGCSIILILSFSLFIILIPNFYNILFESNLSQEHFHHQFILFSILSALLLLGSLYGKGILKVFLESKFMAFWGRISFSAYLFHMLILKLIVPLNIDATLKTSIFILSTALVSFLSFRYFELPIQKVVKIPSL